jgi:hypothetical protein
MHTASGNGDGRWIHPVQEILGRIERGMYVRTTLDIAADVLQAAKERAQRERKTVGEMISDLARRPLTAPQESSAVKEPKAVYGLRPFPARGTIVTNESGISLQRFGKQQLEILLCCSPR